MSGSPVDPGISSSTGVSVVSQLAKAQYSDQSLTYDVFEFTDIFPGGAVKNQERSLLTADSIKVLATAMYSSTKVGSL